ncbi:hypothetical protein CORC01_05396 [Colletotrichum orchidophilum]|uniref:Uncharacterized protein n=1 Tax=Colletotrichum orchidophilum TaxID=1209926 RepID=A0A1G4BDC1_9PEZI|nr:uncharacterized protein CORC01_05396 [Colletotrichum orchidophilum]OHE99355.1 hypothetical protein CORC01_05396 [Colletotrichum orchidophilum]
MSDSSTSQTDGDEEKIRHLHAELKRYKPKETLTLCPRNPGIPYGLPEYGEETRPESNEWLLPNFDPTIDQPDHEAQVEVISYLKGDIHRDALVLLCNITKAPSIRHGAHHPLVPGRKFVLKVYNPTFYLSARTPSELANQSLSREANAYEYFYNQGMTGHPHMVPQYYGSWALKFDVSEPSRGSRSPKTRRWRCAGAILIEHIQGLSLEHMCKRDEGGAMNTDEAFLPFPDSDSVSGSEKKGIPLNEMPARLKVFK